MFASSQLMFVRAPKVAFKLFGEVGRELADLLMLQVDGLGDGKYDVWTEECSQKMVRLIDGARLEGGEEAIRNDVCMQALIEKMQQREFFCCELCGQCLFTYVQFILHIFMAYHTTKAREEPSFTLEPPRRTLTFISKLPVLWSETEANAFRSYGGMYGMFVYLEQEQFRPSPSFIERFERKYERLLHKEGELSVDAVGEGTRLQAAARAMLARVKTPLGLAAMVELHDYLGEGECPTCYERTGDRETYYTHLLMNRHVRASFRKTSSSFDLITTLVNVYRKDLVVMQPRVRRNDWNDY